MMMSSLIIVCLIELLPCSIRIPLLLVSLQTWQSRHAFRWHLIRSIIGVISAFIDKLWHFVPIALAVADHGSEATLALLAGIG